MVDSWNCGFPDVDWDATVGSPAPSPSAFIVRAWVPITGLLLTAAVIGLFGWLKNMELRRVETATVFNADFGATGASERRVARVVTFVFAVAGVVVFGFLVGFSETEPDPLTSLALHGGGVSVSDGCALKSLRFREMVVALVASGDSRISANVLNLILFSVERDCFR